jgi:hypothetical protein
MQQLLLLLITLALMVAPMRSSFSLPMAATADSTEHCAHLQDGMQGMHPAAGLHDRAVDAADHGCDRGCAGDCCHGTCGTCMHATVALPAMTVAIGARYSSFLSVPVSHHFAGRTVHPPFRPPIVFS